MKDDEQDRIQEIEFRFSAIIRAIRKEASLSQKEAAALLGLTQSTFSKVERGLVSTGVENWLNFASNLAINFDAPLLGIVDFGKPCGYDLGPEAATRWKIPSKFISQACVSSKLISILSSHLHEHGHGKKIKDFYQSRFIDDDYFFIAHNCVSLTYLSELLDFLGLKFSDLKIDQMPQSMSFKRHAREVLRSPIEIQFLEEIINQRAAHFENLFTYKITIDSHKMDLKILNRDAKSFKDNHRELDLVAKTMQQIVTVIIKSKLPNIRLSLNFGP